MHRPRRDAHGRWRGGGTFARIRGFGIFWGGPKGGRPGVICSDSMHFGDLFGGYRDQWICEVHARTTHIQQAECIPKLHDHCPNFHGATTKFQSVIFAFFITPNYRSSPILKRKQNKTKQTNKQAQQPHIQNSFRHVSSHFRWSRSSAKARPTAQRRACNSCATRIPVDQSSALGARRARKVSTQRWAAWDLHLVQAKWFRSVFCSISKYEILWV